ncbi:hypothetical protein BpHYR1_027194 [Brachionus plicatilis]|uniref:Uncharacterized protein n=1 Tax=Brachionus plicatilis TaxID=10195 RepID=A0A3M7P3U0_BRAPC|nr:hypothetical protein BpHYR1_027194 [Brachionus plicatilis]
MAQILASFPFKIPVLSSVNNKTINAFLTNNFIKSFSNTINCRKVSDRILLPSNKLALVRTGYDFVKEFHEISEANDIDGNFYNLPTDEFNSASQSLIYL